MTLSEKTVPARDLRRDSRGILDDAEFGSVATVVQRFDRDSAVVVPVGWYRRARVALGEDPAPGVIK